MCKVRKSDETQSAEGLDRRGFLKAGVAGAAAVTTLAAGSRPASAAENPYAEPAKPGLPPSNMVLNLKRTALVVTDPQVDFLSPEGVTWGVVGESVKQHNTVENLRRLFEAAKQVDMTVAISPHYYYPTDKGWKFEGALEKLMHKIGMFDRESPYTMNGFQNSGADFMPDYKKYRTRSTVPKRTIWCCSFARITWTRSFSPACQRICASNHICVSCSSRVSKWQS
jgi:hypothetical protein